MKKYNAIGTYYNTKLEAEKGLKEKNRLFKNGFKIIDCGLGWLVVSKKQIIK